MSTSDSDLWSAALAHDGSAFAELFRRHRDRVFRHCLRLVDTPTDAEDVVAAAFLELWRRRARVVLVEGSVLPWLLVTSGNLARNVRRSARRYRRLLDALPRPDDVSPPGVPSEVDAILRTLRGADRALVTLVVLEGYPVTDAAAVLGLSAGAARTRLMRAKRALRTSVVAAGLAVDPTWRDAT